MMINRITWLSSLGCIAGALVLIGQLGGTNIPGKKIANAQPVTSPSSLFEVHEWGTFTSMQGAGGLELAGLHHEEESLPQFVHQVTQDGEREQTQVGRSLRKTGASWFEQVTQKMETPVIYFYSKTPRSVDVRVDFPGGLISQWYPQASSQSIDYLSGVEFDKTVNPRSYAAADAGDKKFVAASSIQWEVDVIPRTMPAPTNIPQVSPSEPWSFARDVDAAYVRNRGSKKESENYLFYRGIANRGMALTVTEPNKDGEVAVENYLGADIPAAFLLEQSPGGARFKSLGSIANLETRTSTLADPMRPSKAVIDELQDAMVAALRKEGLFKKEAKAMVKTWSRSWFGNEGSRVIYIVPRKTTDAMLPIAIEPKPDKLVRVLVGRVEYISAKTSQEVRAAVLDLSAKSKAKRQLAQSRISRLGRFTEAHLHNLIRILNIELHAKYSSLLGKRTVDTFLQYVKDMPKLRDFRETYRNARAELAKIQAVQ